MKTTTPTISRPRKKAVNGKSKGSTFERKICKFFSLWISHGTRDDLLWRSAMSGGRATVQRKKGISNKTQIGDISAVDPLGAWLIDRFILECKNYFELDITGSILSNRGKLYQFWTTSFHQDFLDQGKEPMLIAHQNQRPTLLITSRPGARMLGLMSPVGKARLIAILPQWGNAYLYPLDVLEEVPCRSVPTPMT